MPLGNPIRKQNESRMVSVLATEGQTVFTVQGGYIINQLSVFRNGVRLSNAEDFTAGDGSTVTLNNAANIDDRIEFHIFDRFTVQNAIVGAASTQTINGDLVLNGKLFGQLDVPSINLTGIVTATELDLNGKADISSDLNVAGVSTFQAVQGTTGTFSGDLSVDGRSDLDEVNVSTGLNVTGVTTLTNNVELISGELFINDKITHADDTNTSIRFPAADTITAETGGSERVRIDSTGRISAGKHGVGTYNDASEWFKVQSDDTAANISIVGSNDTHSTLNLGDEDDFNIQKIKSDHTNNSLQFYTADTERLRINSSGHVVPGADSAYDLGLTGTRWRNLYADTLYGDGSNLTGITQTTLNNNADNRIVTGSGTANTLNAESNLTYNGGTTFTQTLDDNTAYSATATTQMGFQAHNQSNTTNSYSAIRLTAGSSSPATAQISSLYTGAGQNDLTFQLETSNTAFEAMRITSTGRMGLGTNNPTTKLHVQQSAVTSAPSRSSALYLENNANCEIQFVGNSSNDCQLRFGTTSNSFKGAIEYELDNNYLNHYTNGSERFRIDGTGRILIGAQRTYDTGTYYDDIVVNNSNTASGAAGGAGLSLVCGATSYGGVIFSNGSSHARGYMKYDMQDDQLVLGTQTIERIMIEDSGNNGDVHIRTGNIVIDTVGRGIDFGATGNGAGSSGESELLDDYEEGNHTVGVYGSGGGSSVTVYASENKLSYNKIGNLVIVKGRIRMNAVSYSGSLRISLPFTVASQDNTNNAHMCAVATHGVDFDSSAGTGSHMGMFLEPLAGNALAEFSITRDNSSWAQATNSNIVTGSYLAFTLMYSST